MVMTLPRSHEAASEVDRGTEPARTGAAVLRVDQVGYPISAPKRAQIMTSSRRPHGIRWVLVRAGTLAGSAGRQESGPGAGACVLAAAGIARHDLGSWSKRYGWVWAVR